MDYLLHHLPLALKLLGQHLGITLLALMISLAVALPTGVILARVRWLQPVVFGFFGLIYTVPSLALLAILIPFFGLGFVPAVIAMVAYAQLVLLRNWVLGLTHVDAGVLEAASGMGMNSAQLFFLVEFPLALPQLLAGMRLATLVIIATATVAAYINAGGLGVWLFEGVITANHPKIVAGGLLVAVLAFSANAAFRALEITAEKRLHSPAG